MLGIEHQAVKFVADIVMVRNVRAAAHGVVELFAVKSDPVGEAPGSARPTVTRARFPRSIAREQADQPHHIAAFDHEATVHEGFGRAEGGVQQDFARNPRVGKADRNVERVRTGGAEALARAVREGDLKAATGNMAGEEAAEEQAGGSAIAALVACGQWIGLSDF